MERTQASSAVLIAADEDRGTHGPQPLSRLRSVCGESNVIIWEQACDCVLAVL